MKYPTESRTSPLDAGSAIRYKSDLAKQFKANQTLSRVAASVDANSAIYDQLSRTVNAIEQGKQEGWMYNTVSQDLTTASIELLEKYRKDLAKIEVATHLNAAQKAEEREKIFAELDILRRANSGQKTKVWANEFRKALFKDVTARTVAVDLLKIGAFVLAGFVIGALLSIGVLGPFAPFAMPLLITAAVCYAAYRIGSAIWNACTTANKVVNEKKAELGKGIIQDAAIMAERDLEVAVEAKQKEMEQPVAEYEAAKRLFADATKDLEAYESTVYNPMMEMEKKIQDYAGALATPTTAAGLALINKMILESPDGRGKLNADKAKEKIRNELLPVLLEERNQAILANKSLVIVKRKFESLKNRAEFCKLDLQDKKLVVESLNQELQDLKLDSKEAEKLKNAQKREAMSEGKGSGASMKSILEEGRKAKKASAAKTSDSSLTRDGSMGLTKKL